MNFLLGFLCFKITLHILFHSDLPFGHTPLHHASYFMAHCISLGLYAYLSFLPPSLRVRVSDFWKADLAMWLSDQIPLVTFHYSWENKSPDSFHAIPGLSLPFLPQLPHFLITLSIYCSHSAELLMSPWYSKHSWSFGIFPFPLPPWFSVSQFPFLTKRSLFNKIWFKNNSLHKYV